MEIEFSNNRIEFEKELNFLDKLVIDFTSILNRFDVKYVIVSGYVSILFGRSRASEDIDIIVEKIDFDVFKRLWEDIRKGFECIITEDMIEAYNEYLIKYNSTRFSKKGKFIPNVEIKFPKIELDHWTLEERKEVILNGNKFFISPLELQIPFKLFLGSEKDIEDARHLYRIFKDKLDMIILEEFNKKLKVGKLFRKYLK